MTRDDARNLIQLLTRVANSNRHQQGLFKDELKSDDKLYIAQLQNAMQGLCVDLDELLD